MANLTTNYGWTKPVVGGDTDAWGTELNTDLDGIDSAVFAVQAVAMGDNRIINGDMRIDQRNSGSSGTGNNNYTVDRWQYVGSVASKGTWGQNLNAVTGPIGFPYYLGFQSSSAYTAVAADYFIFAHNLEGDAVGDLAWGTVNAQPITISFWASSSKTGTFSGSVGNYAGTRSYPFSFSLPTANSWTRIVVTILGDTSGTWVMKGNAGSLFVGFDLGSGATQRGPASAWASTYYTGVTGAQSLVATNGATFYVTGVKLEIGSVATPFNRQSLAKSMADCQRYYQVLGPLIVGGNTAATTNVYNSIALPVTMRAGSQGITYSNISYSNCSALATWGVSSTALGYQVTVTATAGYAVNFNVSLSAEL